MVNTNLQTLKQMQAIISNGKRTQIYSSELNMAALQAFIANQFPKMKNVIISFKDKDGNSIDIDNEKQIESLKEIYSGQNFVQVDIRGAKKEHLHGHKGHKHQKHGHKGHGHHEHKMAKKTQVLSKACGGQPANYINFVEKNNDLKLGQLIKLYSQQNGIKVDQRPRSKSPSMRRAKILARVFNGEPKDFVDYQSKYSDLNIGQLIKQYSDEKNLTPQQAQKFMDKDEDKRERKLRKLSKFFDKPQEQFVELVEKNPGMNFKQLLDKLKQENGVEINEQKLRNFRKEQQQIRKSERLSKKEHQKTLSKPKKENSHKKSVSKRKVEQKQEKTQMKQEAPVKNKQQEMRSKGRMLLTMKEMFGEGNGKEYFKFIEDNFSLGEQAILDKWISLHHE